MAQRLRIYTSLHQTLTTTITSTTAPATTTLNLQHTSRFPSCLRVLPALSPLFPAQLHTHSSPSQFPSSSLSGNGNPTAITTDQSSVRKRIPISMPRSLFGPTIFTRGMAKKVARRKDHRVRMIKYTLNHPLTPRPLKFGYMRYLRHWTIHRAWQLYQKNLRTQRELELERQYNYMREACEELARTDERLFRIATSKKGVGYFPIEMRIPTDTPPRGGWNHGWTRPVGRG